MNVTGPTPVGPRLDDPNTAFRLNQRFEAEVLQVAGERVAISVGGVAIVARLTSPEQAAILAQHRRALFQVQEGGPELRLKLVTAGSAPAEANLANNSDPTASLLRLAGLPIDELNLQIARACMQNRLAVTREVVVQLRACLEQALAPPGQDKTARLADGASLAHAAQTAASWAASGRPLSPAALSLLLQDLPPLTGLLASLRSSLSAARLRLSPEDAAHAQAALEWLEALAVDLPPDGALPEKLAKALHQLSRSLESELAALDPQNEFRIDENSRSGLIRLALLSRSLNGGEHSALRGEIGQFLDGLAQQNLRNTPAGGQEQWMVLEIPCSVRQVGLPEHTDFPVQLRILKDADADNDPAAPRRSRFVIQAEAAPGKIIEVDISILERNIQVYVSAPDSTLLARANAELATFSQGLEKLGYAVQDAVIGVHESEHTRSPAPDAARAYHADWRA